MKNKGLLILIGILITITIAVIALSLFPFLGKTPNKPTGVIPTPTKTEIITEFPSDFNSEAISTVQYSTKAAEINKKEFLIGDLITLLPYNGNLFRLSYDYAKDGFSLIFIRQSLIEAQKEFDSFLNTNGISDPSWIENVVISYQ